MPDLEMLPRHSPCRSDANKSDANFRRLHVAKKKHPKKSIQVLVVQKGLEKPSTGEKTPQQGLSSRHESRVALIKRVSRRHYT